MTKPTETPDIEVPDDHSTDLVLPAEAAIDETIYAPALDAKRFKQRLDRRQQNRETLINWIRENLVLGVDYGRIHVVKKSECPDGPRCENPYHWSKPSLWKPGAEKICGMLGWTATFPNLRDYQQRALLGKPFDSIWLLCEVRDAEGHLIGEGSGERHLSVDGRDYNGTFRPDINKAAKMAEKSAMVDAVLRSAGLSEIFTQDLEGDDPGTGVDPYTPQARPGDNPMSRSTKINPETHCPIGKDSKGKPWEEVEGGMLAWICQNIDDKPELVARARREQDRRIGLEQEQRAEERDSDPTRQAPGSPDAEDRESMADAYRRLKGAKTIEELEAQWADTTERWRVPLRREYDKFLTALGGDSK